MNELTLMPRSTVRVLNMINAESQRAVTKVNGKAIKKACDLWPDFICFEDRSFFGKGETFSYLDLKARGVKSILVRCNQDRDVLMIKVT